MPQKCLKLLRLEEHMAQARLLGCKRYSIALLNLYKIHNPAYDESTLFRDALALSMFRGWRARNKLNSVKVEGLRQADLEEGTQIEESLSEVSLSPED